MTTLPSAPITIATWNILAEEYLRKYAKRGAYRGVTPAGLEGRAERVAATVLGLAKRNDVVFLQEADERAVIALRELGLPVSYAPRGEGKRSGLAWLVGPRVRLLAEFVDALDLREGTSTRPVSGATPELIGRNWVTLELEICGKVIRAIGTHLTPDHVRLIGIEDRRSGAAQIARILVRLPPRDGVMDVVAGDLNAPPGASSLDALAAAGFHPLSPPPGTADWTAAVAPPDGSQGWERLDWILVRGADLTASHLRASDPVALPLPSLEVPSDHLPLEACVVRPLNRG